MAKYILYDKDEETATEWDSLEHAREQATELIEDNEDARENLKLFKVADEYEVVASKKVLFKKIGSNTEE